MIWNKTKTNDFYHHTAPTVYVVDGYKVWKGKYYVISCICSADEWHLQRTTGKKEVIYSAKTATECMNALESGLYK